MGRRKDYSPDIHLNLNVRGLPVSATLYINEKSNELRKQGRHVYKLGLGQSPFPVPQPVVDALKVNAHQKDYQPVKGLFQLREAVADYYRRSQGISYDAEDVLIGPGSKELMFLLQLVYYGDLVIPTPSWVSYAPQAHIIGRHVRWLPTRIENDWKLIADELTAQCKHDPNKPRIVILNYPSNPAGTTYTIDELKAIARVAFNHKIILLSDEIYGELHHRGKHISIARFYPEGTIISGGLSKWCGAGGWRLGTFTFPRKVRWLLDAMAAVASETYTATSAPIQYGAVRAFRGGTKIENYLWYSRTILRRLGRILARMLKETGTIVPEPDGAFYLFPDFSPLKDQLRKKGIMTSEQFCEKLLEDTGVAVLPGSAFGRPSEELTTRIAYVDFDGVRAISAAEQLKDEKAIDEEFLETYCGNTIRAIELLCDWLMN
jgi:aspartate aminotransferase